MFLKQSEASAQSLVTRHKYSILSPPSSGAKTQRGERRERKKERIEEGLYRRGYSATLLDNSTGHKCFYALKIQTPEFDGYSSKESERS